MILWNHMARCCCKPSVARLAPAGNFTQSLIRAAAFSDTISSSSRVVMGASGRVRLGGRSGMPMTGRSSSMPWRRRLPMSAAPSPVAAMRSVSVVAFRESGMPLRRTPWSDGIRPVIRVARSGMRMGVAVCNRSKRMPDDAGP